MKSERRLAVLIALSAALFFVIEPLVIKFMTLDPWTILGLRSFLCAPMTALWMRYDQGRWPSLKETSRGRLVLAAGLVMMASNIFWVLCVVWTTVSNAVVLYHTTPIFAALIGFFLLGDKLSRKDVGALLLAGSGLVCILLAGPPSGDWWGEFFALLCGLDFAVYLIILRRIKSESDKFTVLFLGHLTCCPLVIFGDLGFGSLHTIGALDWYLMVGLAILSTAAFVCVSKASRGLEGYEVALWMLAEPVLGVMMGFILLKEEPKLFIVMGALFLILSMYTEARKNGKGEQA